MTTASKHSTDIRPAVASAKAQVDKLFTKVRSDLDLRDEIQQGVIIL